MKILILTFVVITGLGTTLVQIGCKAKNAGSTTEKAVERPEDQPNRSAIVEALPAKVEASPSKELPTIQIAIDATASSDFSVLTPSVESLRQAIESARTSKIAVVRLGEGGKSSWAGSVQNFELPLLPAGSFDAEAAVNAMEQKCRKRLRCREQRLQTMEVDFNSSKNEQTTDTNKARRSKSLEMADHLLASPKGFASCTNMIEFRDRLISDGYKLVVFYTDGDHECATSLTTKRFDPEVKVLILQMPLKSESSGSSFSKRTIALQKIFVGEGVTVMPVVSADDKVLRNFFRGETLQQIAAISK